VRTAWGAVRDSRNRGVAGGGEKRTAYAGGIFGVGTALKAGCGPAEVRKPRGMRTPHLTNGMNTEGSIFPSELPDISRVQIL